MAITFPRLLPTRFAASQSLLPSAAYDVSASGAGKLYGAGDSQTLWRAEWPLSRTMSQAKSDEVQAWMDSLRGPIHPFYGTDLFRPFPLLYLDSGWTGLVRGSSAGGAAGAAFAGVASSWSLNTDRDQLTLAGLPAGFVISMRDPVGFLWSGGTRPTFVRALETMAANAAGQITAMSIEPAVPLVVPAGASAHFNQPSCLMKLDPEKTQIGQSDRRGRISGVIAAVQDLVS